jgi:hypothetical protein
LLTVAALRRLDAHRIPPLVVRVALVPLWIRSDHLGSGCATTAARVPEQTAERSVSSATISLTTRQKITNVGSGTYDLGDRCSAFTCSASSERSGLSRFSVARSESPLLRVTKPRALLHHFCVLPTLVSPVRPPRFPGQRCDQLPANAMSCCALMPTGCGLRRANETPGRAFYGISCSRSTSAGGGRRLGLW